MLQLLRRTVVQSVLLALLVYSLARAFQAAQWQSVLLAFWFGVVPIYIHLALTAQSGWGKTLRQRLFSLVFVLGFQFIFFVPPLFGYRLDLRVAIATGVGILGTFLICRFFQSPIPRTILTLLLASSALGYLAVSISICTFVVCRPHSWVEQRAFINQIMARQPTGTRFDGIYVYHDRFSTIRSGADWNLEVSISFTQSIPSPNYPDTPYAISSIDYNDRDPERTRTNNSSNGWTNTVPNPQETAAWESVKYGPRDVLNQTLSDAQQTLNFRIADDYANPSLHLAEYVPERFNKIAVWEVSYVVGKQELEFWLDAQTGAILERTIHK
jgi:hypothetical protein